MATPKIMKLVDPSTGLMECRCCGAAHIASLRSRGRRRGKYRRGSWQCQHGCKLPAKAVPPTAAQESLP